MAEQKRWLMKLATALQMLRISASFVRANDMAAMPKLRSQQQRYGVLHAAIALRICASVRMNDGDGYAKHLDCCGDASSATALVQPQALRVLARNARRALANEVDFSPSRGVRTPGRDAPKSCGRDGRAPRSRVFARQ
jgi:hypothetical protein